MGRWEPWTHYWQSTCPKDRKSFFTSDLIDSEFMSCVKRSHLQKVNKITLPMKRSNPPVIGERKSEIWSILVPDYNFNQKSRQNKNRNRQTNNIILPYDKVVQPTPSCATTRHQFLHRPTPSISVSSGSNLSRVISFSTWSSSNRLIITFRFVWQWPTRSATRCRKRQFHAK